MRAQAQHGRLSSGAGLAVLAFVLVLWWLRARTSLVPDQWLLGVRVLGLDLLFAAAVSAVVAGVSALLARIVRRRAPWPFLACLAASVVLVVGMGTGLSIVGTALIVLPGMVAAGLLGAALRFRIRSARGSAPAPAAAPGPAPTATGPRRRRAGRPWGVLAAVAAAVLLAQAGLLLWPGSSAGQPQVNLTAPPAGEVGATRTLAYGPGTALATQPVDATAVVRGWSQGAAPARTTVWGFDASRLPVRGTLHAPDDAGPHPLVVVLHGNSSAGEHAELGFEYLAEALAGRGYVVALVDENFLNTGLADRSNPVQGLDEARAWLALRHLDALRGLNDQPGTALTGRVDFERVALVGHSRGGEAVAVAADLDADRERPSGIRAVVALAPSDLSGALGRGTNLEGVSYLTVAGTLDADVGTFAGTGQYERTDPGPDGLRAAVTLPRANHNQFNSRWARTDVVNAGVTTQLLDRAALLRPEQQREAAVTLTAGFLETTVRGGDLRWLDQPDLGVQLSPGSTLPLAMSGPSSPLARKRAAAPVPVHLLTPDGELTATPAGAAGPAREMDAFTVDVASTAAPGSDVADRIDVEITDSSGHRAQASLPDGRQLPAQYPGNPMKLAFLSNDAPAEPTLQTLRVDLRAMPGLDRAAIASVRLTVDGTDAVAVANPGLVPAGSATVAGQ